MLRDLLPVEEETLQSALALGRAWVLGRRSVPPADGSWAPVVSGIGLDPKSFPRVTGETLIAMIGKARREILITTAYVDGGAIASLLPSLEAAAHRGVSVVFAAVRTLERDNALALLETEFASKRLAGLTVKRLETVEGFPHLKVLVADGRSAYLGSANFTWAGMTTNFEIGALVEGSAVEAIRSFVLSLIGRPVADADAGPEDAAL
jgi:phosphatidylserine/phosphatidylglycerophosphate/cardiolipin synthase-like enzyme